MEQKLFEEIYGKTSPRMSEALFNEVYKMDEANASAIVSFLVKGMDRFIKNGCIPADGAELAASFKKQMGDAATVGEQGVVNDLGNFYAKYDTKNAIAAAVAFRCTSPKNAFDFYSRYCKDLNIDLNEVQQAVQLAQQNKNLSLSAAQKQVQSA